MSRAFTAWVALLLLPLSGCLFDFGIDASVDDYALSPDGEGLAFAIYSGKRYTGNAVAYYRNLSTGQETELPIPFDAYTFRFKFQTNEVLDVLAISKPGPNVRTSLFIIDLQTMDVREAYSWAGGVFNFVRWNNTLILAMHPQGLSHEFDFADEDGRPLTDVKLRQISDMILYNGTIYFGKASPTGPYSPAKFPEWETAIMTFNPETHELALVFTKAAAESAGVVHSLRYLCSDGATAVMIDEFYPAPKRVPVVYQYDFEDGTLQQVRSLPYGAIAPCIRNDQVYYVKLTGRNSSPEELWVVDMDGGTPRRLAP